MTPSGSPTPPSKSDSTGALVAIVILAIASCAVWLWMTRIAHRFVWGEGYEDRPTLQIMLALAILWAIWGGIVWIASNLNAAKCTGTALTCCAAGLVSQLFFLNANPILEHDGYRYLWDGATLDSGVSPYRYAPSDIASANAFGDPSPEKQRLFQRILTDTHAAQTLARVGYPEIKTIYPPAAQFVFLAAFKIGSWSWTGLRVVFIAAYFIGVLLTRAAVRTPDSTVTHLIAQLSLCPLAIKEIGNSAHLDAMLVLYFGSLLFILSRHERTRPLWLAIGTGSLMALAIATKLYPLIAMPVVAAWFASRYSWRTAGVIVGSTALSLVALFAPFLAMGERHFFSALTAFGNTWQRNESLFGVIQCATTFILGDSTITLSHIPGASGPIGTVVAKLITSGSLLAVCAGCTRHVFLNARVHDPVRLVSKCLSVLFIAWFLLLPMAYPWYLLGVLPFLACAQLGPIPWVLIACVSVFYYGDFYIDAFDLPNAYATQLLRIEYGLPLAFALVVWTVGTAKRRSASTTPFPVEGASR